MKGPVGFADRFFGDHVGFIEKAIEAAALRQKIIANNIANASTPGYRPTRIAYEHDFKKILDTELAFMAPDYPGKENEVRLVSEVKPVTPLIDNIDPLNIVGSGQMSYCSYDPSTRIYKSDEEIDIHDEMVRLTQNQLSYTMLTSGISGAIGGVKYVLENFGR